LQRISPDKVTGALLMVGSFLKLPAVRCAPCRHNFFSLRPLLPAERLAGIAADNISPK
jgi:hypothetical protein